MQGTSYISANSHLPNFGQSNECKVISHSCFNLCFSKYLQVWSPLNRLSHLYFFYWELPVYNLYLFSIELSVYCLVICRCSPYILDISSLSYFGHCQYFLLIHHLFVNCPWCLSLEKNSWSRWNQIILFSHDMICAFWILIKKTYPTFRSQHCYKLSSVSVNVSSFSFVISVQQRCVFVYWAK